MKLKAWLVYIESLSVQCQHQYGVSYDERKRRFELFKSFANSLGLLTGYGTIITVAGTNGKGTCVAGLVSILKASGYTVGSYTSPHLVKYNERIQINGTSVDDAQLCSQFALIERERKNLLLGYTEFSTLAALLLFKQAKLDFVVLEVGVGGRFSTVNILDSDVALVSSIAYDHMQLLGNTLEKIAFEKIGIVRSLKTCVWGNPTVPSNVIEYVKQLQVKLQVQDKAFGVLPSANQSLNTWTWWNQQITLKHLVRPKQGYLPNLACVLQALYVLNTLPSQDVINQGLKNMHLPGRFQIIPGNVMQILDVAHNPASAELLAKNLLQQNISGRVLSVTSMLTTKDIKNTLQPLCKIVSQWYLGALKDSSAASNREMSCLLETQGIKNYCLAPTLMEAYHKALKEAQANDVIVVWGSFRTVGAVMEDLC